MTKNGMTFKFYDSQSKKIKEGYCLGVCSVGAQNSPAIVLVDELSQTIHVVGLEEIRSVVSKNIRKAMKNA